MILCDSFFDFCFLSLCSFICFANVGCSPTPCEENAALPCVVLGTNDMTQNTLELAAFDRVFLLDADDAQGVAPALEALGEEPDGFILFERYHDEANIETVLRTTGLECAERLFEHQYQVYWVH